MQNAISDLNIQPSHDNLWNAVLAFFVSVGAFFQGISMQEVTIVSSFICSATGFLCGITVLWRFYWEYKSREQSRKNEVSKNARRWKKSKNSRENS